MKRIAFAKSWGVKTPQGAEVPKNAIYGKIGRIYYYVSDKGKKSLADNSKYAEIFTLDERSKRRSFKQTIVEQEGNALCDFIKSIAWKTDWFYSEPCSFSLGIQKANVTPRYNTDCLNERVPKYMDRKAHTPVGECKSASICDMTGACEPVAKEKIIMSQKDLADIGKGEVKRSIEKMHKKEKEATKEKTQVKTRTVTIDGKKYLEVTRPTGEKVKYPVNNK